MTAPAQLTCEYASLVNDVAYHLFGLRHTTTDVITESVASTNQAADILRCIAKGLQYVYSAYEWSFLHPKVSITTYASYSTGTITVDAAGAVTGVDTVFPTYSASAGGWLNIPGVGAYAVATYVSGVGLTLTGFPAGSVFTVASTYSLYFPSYAMPSGVDSFKGRLTLPQGSNEPAYSLTKVSEVEIRRLLAQSNVPCRPSMYAETMNTFDPTAGSSRYVTFYPVPDASYVFSGIGTLRPSMIDSANKYPLGIEVLAPCIAESCLAAAEREIEQKDAAHPDAVHNRALIPLLALAIQRDKEYGSPDTLGVDHGQEDDGEDIRSRRSGGIYWNAGGDTTGFI